MLIFEGQLVIFGGDRHHFPFSDTYCFDLANEMKSRGIDVPVGL